MSSDFEDSPPPTRWGKPPVAPRGEILDPTKKKGGRRLSKPDGGHSNRMTMTALRTLNRVEKDLGGRDVLLEKLLPYEDKDKKLQTLLDMLADPMNAGVGLGKICDLAGYNVAGFLTMLREGRAAVAFEAAMDKVYEKIPAVAAHVMDRALPREVPCATCFGETDEEKKKRCAGCFGQGKVLVEPSKDHWQTALEMGGLLKRGGGGVQVGVSVQQSQVLPGGPQASNSPAFRSVSDEILFGGRGLLGAPRQEDVVEAEFTEKEREPEVARRARQSWPT